MDKITRAFRRVGRMTEDEARRAASGRPGATRTVARILLLALESMERETVESKPENAIMEPAGDSYENHPGRAGGGSLPRGSSSADLRKRARENPNVRNGLDGDDTFHAVGGFEKHKLERHMEKHGYDLGYRDKAAYQRAAMEFMESPLSETQEEISMPDGRRCRIDHATKMIGIVKADRNLSTYYELDTSKQSTVEKIEEWIKIAKQGKSK